MKRLPIFSVFLIFSHLPVSGAEELVIGRILIDRGNVFATGTDWDKKFPYSWANRLHIVTRESYIRRAILFREGDPYDPNRILESERLLRSRPIFRYVSIKPQEPLNGRVDILIETEDVWTTSIHLAYGTAGGKNFYRVGVLEHNFLGRGHKVGAFVRQDIDRFIRGISYSNPQFLGSRWQLGGGYGVDEKGKEWVVSVEKPYYSVLRPWSHGVSVSERDDEERLFENGSEVGRFQHQNDALKGYLSRSLHPREERVQRLQLIYSKNDDVFSDFVGQVPAGVPKSRRLRAIEVGWEQQNINFIKKRGVTTFDRDEDLNLGWAWNAEAGPYLRSLGSTSNGYLGQLRSFKYWNPWDNHVLFTSVLVEGRAERSHAEDAMLRLQSEYTILDWWRENTAVFRADYLVGRRLNKERQFLLGGENGLRGYSVRQFSGTKRALLVLENRRVIAYDWLHLVSVGWAVFADAGAVWKEHQPPSFREFKGDVGFGLRFAPSRSVDPSLIRMDIAYALSDNQRSSRWVINIGGDIRFGQRTLRKFEQS